MSHDHGDHDHGDHGHGMASSMEMDSDMFCAGSGRVMLQGFQVTTLTGRRRDSGAFDAGSESVVCVGGTEPLRYAEAADGNLSLRSYFSRVN